MIRVVLADAQDEVREGLSVMVESEDDMTVVGQAGTGAEAVYLTVEQRPDVVLMDLQLPNMDGTRAIRYIHRQLPDVGILILTRWADREHALAGITAGAHGYLLKSANAEQILESIRVVDRGGSPLASTIAATVLTKFHDLLAGIELPEPRDDDEPHIDSPLTPREQEVLTLLAQGLPNQDIADELVISVHTVKVHVSHILGKFKASNRTMAVAEARRRGFLPR